MDETFDLQSNILRYLPYLLEVRKRLLFITMVFFVAWVIGFIYYQPIISFIIKLYDSKGINIAFTSPYQFINLAINTGFVMGILITFPLILYQLLSFLKPALRTKEYRLILKVLPFSIILYIAGFLFGAWLMGFVVTLFAQNSAQLQIQNLWDVNSFLSQILFTALLLGLLFQLPIVLTLLLRFHLIKHGHLTKQRPIIYVIILVIVILLPPTDLFSMVMMFFPLAIIFECALLLNRNIQAKEELHTKKFI